LSCFPSFGFLLAAQPSRADALGTVLAAWPELLCCRVGRFVAGKAAVVLTRGGQRQLLWDAGTDPLTGF
jgi:uncharacterized protein